MLCEKTNLSSYIYVWSVFANYHVYWAYHTTYKKPTSSSCVRSNPKRRWQRGNSLFLTNRTSNANCILRWQRNNSLLETRQFLDGLGVVMRRATCLRYLGPFHSHQPTHFSKPIRWVCRSYTASARCGCAWGECMIVHTSIILTMKIEKNTKWRICIFQLFSPPLA